MVLQLKERSLFPITSISSFLNLVECHLTHSREGEPNLAFLSIVFGYLEHELTVNRIHSADGSNESPEEISGTGDVQTEYLASKVNEDAPEFPTLHLEVVEGLLDHFELMMKAQIDRSLTESTTRSGYATRQLCKRVSDVVWNGLLRSYHKDKAHIQTLFSYLTNKQLDCFGLAFAVVAACQRLKYSDVHLVISGDHAWAACGEDGKEMVEITWHGHGSEDIRGSPVDSNIVEKNWIYHGGKAVKCDRWMEVVALVVSLNPSIDIHTDSCELSTIQYKVLRMLHERSHLDRYPLSLTTFAELSESINPNEMVVTERLHNKAMSVARNLYDDLHILPHCGKGNFCLRQGRCKEAIQCYAEAAQVASKYNYSKEDEEIYKELIEIASDLIPQALKEAPDLCGDAECYREVIRFYDGICLWEEGSSTPVLHSWWARNFTTSLHRFSPDVRESFRDDACNSPISSSPKSSQNTKDLAGNRRNNKKDSFCSQIPDFPQKEKSSRDSRPIPRLHLRSEKMTALKEMLTNGKKLKTQSIGLLLTAQSQVHFVKRKSSSGDYSMEYSGSKRTRRPRDLDA